MVKRPGCGALTALEEAVAEIVEVPAGLAEEAVKGKQAWSK
jgi:hypothetical protein